MENLEQEQKIENANIEKEAQNQQPVNEEKIYFGHKKGQNIYESFLTNKMFAHRGFWNEEVPENSLGAFKLAVENGYGIEFDVQAIEDGTPVVFHDSKMSRMTGKDKYIQNLSREEFEKIKLLDSEEKIPTFEETLKLVDGKVPLLIEIKHHEKVGELEAKILDLLQNYNGEYVVQSFDPFVLKWFYENAPEIWRGQLSGFFKGEKLNIISKALLKRLKTKKIAHYDFVNYDINFLPNMWTKRLEVPVLTWTVDSQEKYIKAIQFADNVVFERFVPKV